MPATMWRTSWRPSPSNTPRRDETMADSGSLTATYTLNDLHGHLGQLVSYARMNQVVPPWSKKG